MTDVPNQAEPSAAVVARDQLLYAIADEAGRVAASQPDTASAALLELARAYASTTRATSGEDVLLFLFDSIPDTVVLREPAVGLSFGRGPDA
ncbi:hypothetical protein [Nocardia sp. NPDC020380]|uniref:hypothetical protein n=1 Tax=Nocardia sp. NPDC020380 TaxID=3364309 RepID=UPI00378A0612